jgi:hypothetical protein
VMIYFHMIDDLLDTRLDGRPVMDSEEIIRIFSYAILVYNSKFYMANHTILMPVMVHVTNAYADCVQFETASEAHKRSIADVIRCCGNDVFFMVALICGGYEHMRKFSPLIRERSWIIQHTEEETRF